MLAREKIDNLDQLFEADFRRLDWWDIPKQFEDSSLSSQEKCQKNLDLLDTLIGCLEKDSEYYDGSPSDERRQRLNVKVGIVTNIAMLENYSQNKSKELKKFFGTIIDSLENTGPKSIKNMIPSLQKLHKKLGELLIDEKELDSLERELGTDTIVNLARTSAGIPLPKAVTGGKPKEEAVKR